jgi:hypothetical protein
MRPFVFPDDFHGRTQAQFVGLSAGEFGRRAIGLRSKRPCQMGGPALVLVPHCDSDGA